MGASSEFLLIRHGQAEGNIPDLVLGTMESPLTELGREQARDRGRMLAGLVPVALHTSPLGRAVESAALIAESLALSSEIDDRLRERFVGAALQGMPNAAVSNMLAAQFAHMSRMSLIEKLNHRYEMAMDAETPQEAVGRFRDFLIEKSVQYADCDGPIVCVTHGALLGNVLAASGFIDFEGIFGASAIGNAAGYRLTFDRRTTHITGAVPLR